MLDLVSLVLILAVSVQGVAAVLALRLNWVYGWRWAWTLISVAVALMTIRLGLTLFRVVALENPAATLADEAFATASASVSLLISLLILAGVASINPIFPEIARAEKVLRAERDGLQHFVSEKEAEFNIARRIQRSFFPKSPLSAGKIDVAGSCWPAAETGGDYFDYFILPDGGLFVVIADVSGHGLGPSLVMTETRAWMRIIAKTEPDPGRLMSRLNCLLMEDAAGYFVSMFVASISPDARRLVYCSAGHPAYMLGTREVRTLEGDGIPLGIQSAACYESSHDVELQRDDLLFLATDGLFEARSDAGEQFGVGRALAMISERSHMSAFELVESLYQQLRAFSKDQLDDDLAVVAVKTLNDA